MAGRRVDAAVLGFGQVYRKTCKAQPEASSDWRRTSPHVIERAREPGAAI